MHLKLFVAATMTCAALAGSSLAAAFTEGNLVVSRIGDGVTAVGSTTSAVFLDEYTTSGVPVGNSIALPTVDSGSNYALTIPGSQTSCGFLSRSADGKYLSIFGYSMATGSATSSSANRAVGVIDYNGNVDTSTRFAQTGATPRSAVTSNYGYDIWTTSDTGSGATGGLRFTNRGSSSATLLNSSITNLRVAKIFNNQLYVSTSVTQKGINKAGNGLPTSGASLTLLNGMPTGSDNGQDDSPYDFFFADSNTLYVADDDNAGTKFSGGIQKWVFDGTNWSEKWIATLPSTIGFRAITGSVDGSGNVSLYAISAVSSGTGTNALVSLSDTLTGSTAPSITSLVTSPSGTVFRGVTFSAVPEPASLGVLAIGGLLALRRRRD